MRQREKSEVSPLVPPLLMGPGPRAKAEVCASLAVCPPMSQAADTWVRHRVLNRGPRHLAFSAIPKYCPLNAPHLCPCHQVPSTKYLL